MVLNSLTNGIFEYLLMSARKFDDKYLRKALISNVRCMAVHRSASMAFKRIEHDDGLIKTTYWKFLSIVVFDISDSVYQNWTIYDDAHWFNCPDYPMYLQRKGINPMTHWPYLDAVAKRFEVYCETVKPDIRRFESDEKMSDEDIVELAAILYRFYRTN